MQKQPAPYRANKNGVGVLHPGNFAEHYIVAQPTPYTFLAPHLPRSAGGVLGKGSDVWLREALSSGGPGTVCAFVSKLGMVSLDARSLLRKVPALGAAPKRFGRCLMQPTKRERSIRPTEFHRNFIVMRDVEYTMIEEVSGNAIPRIGMLPVGSTVYLPEKEEQLGEARIVAYAEQIGKIAVSRNFLAARR